MKERMPQYLHLPLQILWFDVEELMVIVVLYVMSLVFGGFMWFGLVIGPYLFMQAKRKYQRGFLRHLLYQGGIYTLEGYPGPYDNEFYE